MRIAVVAFEDLSDIKLWASIPYFVIDELKRQGITIHLVDKIPETKNNLLELVQRFYYNKLLNKKAGIYRVERNQHHLKKKALKIENELKKIDYDLVLSFFPYQTALLQINKPVVIWTDATFKLLHQYYPSYRDFHSASYNQALNIEKQAMDHASLLIYSSQWAAQSSINDFNNHKDKVKVIPFGANLTHDKLNKASILSEETPLELLFIGFDAERKGLRKAIEVTHYLNDKNIKATLTVIGPHSLDGYATNHVNFLGQLNKDNVDDLAVLDKAYQKAHFFVLFPSCEAYGIVFCEAASYGVPSITHGIGGVSEIIKDGVNGYKFAQADPIKKIGNLLISYHQNPDKYNNLRESCLKDYEKRLNWRVAIQQLLIYLAEVKSES